MFVPISMEFRVHQKLLPVVVAVYIRYCIVVEQVAVLGIHTCWDCQDNLHWKEPVAPVLTLPSVLVRSFPKSRHVQQDPEQRNDR